jgi:uncharacterized protein (DUF302 family)
MDLFVIEKSQKPFNEAVEAVSVSAKKFGFNVVHIHEMHKTFEKNGLDFSEYSIIEICNPQKAHFALSKDFRMGNLMPKHIIVFIDNDGLTNIMTMKGDSRKLENIFPGKGIGELSKKVSETLELIIQDAR